MARGYSVTQPNYASAGGAPSFSSAAYGSRPGATAIPDSVWQEGAASNPGLYGQTDASNALIKGQMAGVLSPETINSLRDNAATFGVTSGMPGSGVAANRGLRDLGRSVQDLQQQGFQNYIGALHATASQQLDPSLVANINMRNADLAAAPDPAAAAGQTEALYQYHYGQQRDQQAKDAAEAERIWQAHYAQTRSPAGGSEKAFGGVTYGGGGGTPYKGGTFLQGAQSPYASSNFSPNYNVGVYGPTGTGSTSIWDDPMYDGMLDPYSPDYQPGGAQ